MPKTINQTDYKKINQLLQSQARIFLPRWLPKGRFHGSVYKPINPMRVDNNEGSLCIDETGLWNDFAINRGGGDFISLYAYLNNLSQSNAAKELMEYLSLNPIKNPPHKTKKTTKPFMQKCASKIWRQSIPIQGTLAEEYLEQRKISSLPREAYQKLRFHKGIKHKETGLIFPALIGLVQDVNGKPIAIQRTYLDPKTKYKANIKGAKKALASIQGGAVKFGKSNQIIITEGIEDALSILLACRGEYAFWAGLGGNTGSVNVPKETQEVIIALDVDKAGCMLADKLVIHLHKQGITNINRATPEGAKDFNEMLMKGDI